MGGSGRDGLPGYLLRLCFFATFRGGMLDATFQKVEMSSGMDL